MRTYEEFANDEGRQYEIMGRYGSMYEKICKYLQYERVKRGTKIDKYRGPHTKAE